MAFSCSLFLVAAIVVCVSGIRDYCKPSFCEIFPRNQSSRVDDFCSSNGFKMDDRCCRDGKVIVGLDLRECLLNDTSFLKNKIYHNLTIVDLTMNPELVADEDDFDGYSALNQLFFDRVANASCPGGANSWNISNGGNNETLECKNQLDTCAVTGFTCPNSIGENSSHCEARGPGLKNLYCVCNEGFRGYKCMRQGTFPKIAFGAGFAGATAGLAGFLWVTNRRLVKP